ncbi:ion transporter [Haliovirga abyssi]|uniref:Ion transport domain-containing protein n=1 Tax=Haliovirga abyssi TaxID=2996794 RepID=A0AAU9DIC9_9FUSO|nr:ion transporter [Haliovirga abyssi]BDU51337.1 hypothetical protein HLVA_19060 [Haliovirga abyssi]
MYNFKRLAKFKKIERKRLYEILEKAKEGDKESKIFDIFMMILISLNVLAVILETVNSLVTKYGKVFLYFEFISVIIFSVEYILRIWVCVEDDKYKKEKNKFKARIKFILSPLSIIDLLAILPFYLPVLIPFDLRIMRAVRLFRLIRLLKVGRYSKAVTTFYKIIKKKREELLISLFIVIVLLIITSSLMYYIENGAQPEAFSSIPAAMWWGIATLTTVGYGDIYPITALGKFLGAIISILGIGLFALPTGILASAFTEEIAIEKEKKMKCPYCGKDIDLD